MNTVNERLPMPKVAQKWHIGVEEEKGLRAEIPQPLVFTGAEGGICPPEPCPSGYSLRGTPGSAHRPGVGPPIQGYGHCGAARG